MIRQETEEQELEWGVDSFESETKEELPFDPANEFDYSYFSENAEKLAADSTFFDENVDHIVASPETAFVETIARLYIIEQGALRAVGTLIWKRLRSQLGFEQAKDSKPRREMIGTWAAKIGAEYYRIDGWVKDAMARDLVPDVALMSNTAGRELAMGITGDNEELVKQTIENRVESARELDPTAEKSTEVVRAVKRLEAEGNHQPRIVKQRNLNPNPVHPEWAFYGNIKVAESVTEEGEIVEHYEYKPLIRVYVEDVQREEIRPQVAEMQDWLMKKLGGKRLDNTDAEVLDGTE